MNTDLLRSSWAEVGRFGDAVAQHFYARLFLAHPDTRQLFGADMAEQRKKLAATLGLVVRSADDLSAVVPVLQRLGRDHRRFGAVEAHYQAVGDALLATLEHFLGEGWTPEVATTWAQAYSAVAEVMLHAAQEANQHTEPAAWDCKILYVEVAPERDQAYLVLTRPWPEAATEGLTLPAALHGAPGDWLTVQPFEVDGGHWAIYIDITDDPRTLALAQARQGDLLRLGAPLDPVDQEARP